MSFVGYDSGVRIDARAAAAAGGSFVLRYLSRGSWSQVSAEEIGEYVAAGLHVGLVFETTANRALAGYGAGKSDAMYVIQQLQILGLPLDMEVFFAVDADVDPVSVDPYFQGVHDEYGIGGVYGSYRVVQRIESEYGNGGWQTAAWSNGNRDSNAAVFQSGEQTVINGVTVDVDYAVSLGKWAYGGNVTSPQDFFGYSIDRPNRTPITLAEYLAAADDVTDATRAVIMGVQSVVTSRLDTIVGLLQQPPAQPVTLSTSDKADIILTVLRTLGAALANVQVVVGAPPAPAEPAPSTPV